MKKRLLILTAVFALLTGWTLSALAYEATLGPAGLLMNNPEKTYKGYTLWAASQGTDTYLIDMEGRVINKWSSPYRTMYAELTEKGTLLRSAILPPAELAANFGGSTGLLQEFDWDGNVIWEYRLSDPKKGVLHHAFDRMPNGNTLVLAWEPKTGEEAYKKGRPAGTLLPVGSGVKDRTGRTRDEEIWPDFVQEVNPKGEVVWEWHAWDHTGKGPLELDLAFQIPLGASSEGLLMTTVDWTHCNSVRYNAKTDQLVISSRNFGEFWIIDKKTGKIVYRFGNPGASGQGKLPFGYAEEGDQVLFGNHDANWTPEGNVTIFDNGCFRTGGAVSRALEIDPKKGEIVWMYEGDGKFNPNMFYSPFESSAQKLPNGNWLICSTKNGHIFEVSQDKKIVWEYVNPVLSKNEIVCTIPSIIPDNRVHRAFRYGVDFAGFKGKDMKPKAQAVNEGCPNWVELFATKPAAAKAK